jgi:hypothetical protein
MPSCVRSQSVVLPLRIVVPFLVAFRDLVEGMLGLVARAVGTKAVGRTTSVLSLDGLVLQAVEVALSHFHPLFFGDLLPCLTLDKCPSRQKLHSAA